MIGRHATRLAIAVVIVALASPSAAYAQQKPQPKPKPAPARQPPRPRTVSIGGYAMAGGFSFTARESFEATLGRSSGPIFGGGARIGIPYGGLFADVGAWRYKDDGERVFVLDNVEYPLNIPMEVSITPIELSGGWQFRIRTNPKLLPYVGGGLTLMNYSETSDFATDAENVEETFTGYHLFGGVEYKLTRWLGAAGEVSWTTVPDAIGDGGVSQAFNEDNLGGVSLRFRITVGR
jgi:opacity protein-like surface antigen